MVRMRESWNQGRRRQEEDETPVPWVASTLEVGTTNRLHDLVLGNTASRLSTLHHVGWTGTGAGVQVLDEGDAQGTTAILVAGEFGCEMLAQFFVCEYAVTYQLQSQQCPHCRIQPHQCRENGHWVRTEFRPFRPCRWWRRDQSGLHCKWTREATYVSACCNTVRRAILTLRT